MLEGENVNIFWSHEDAGWIAVDMSRPGCSAWGADEDEVVKELRDAQAAWDGARSQSLHHQGGK